MPPRRKTSLTNKLASTKKCINSKSDVFQIRKKPLKSKLASSRTTRKRLKSKTCVFCGKGFCTYAELESHMSVHTKERPYQCNYCEATFGFYSAKFLHEKNQHTGNRKKFSCSHCSKSYSVVTKLISHKRREHYSQSSTRAISNGMLNITKAMGILNTSKNGVDFKDKNKATNNTPVLKLTRIDKKKIAIKDEEEMQINDIKSVKVASPASSSSSAVPTPSKLLSLVNSLALVTQRKRSSVSSRQASVDDENSSQQEPLIDVKSPAVMMIKEEEDEARTNEPDKNPQSIKSSPAAPLVSTAPPPPEEPDEASNNFVGIKSEFEEAPTTAPIVITTVVIKEEEEREALPPQTSSSSSTATITTVALREKPLEMPTGALPNYPIFVYIGPDGTITPATTIDTPMPWINRPPDPPPNLMFYFEGKLMPVFSMDVYRSMRQPSPPPESQPPPPYDSEWESIDLDFLEEEEASPPKRGLKKRVLTKPARYSSPPKSHHQQSSEMEQSTKPKRKNTRPPPKSRRPTSSSTTTASTSKETNKGVKCEECGYICRYPSRLAGHLRMHARVRNKRFSCDICGSRYSRENNLRHHLRQKHGHVKPTKKDRTETEEEKSFSCNICGFVFSAKDNLVAHLETIHSQPRDTIEEGSIEKETVGGQTELES